MDVIIIGQIRFGFEETPESTFVGSNWYGLNDNLMTISFDKSNDLKLYLKLGRDVCSVIIVAIFKCLSR